MKKRSIKILFTIVIVISVFFAGLGHQNLSIADASEGWQDEIVLRVTAPSETLGADTVRVSVELIVPEGGRLDVLQGTLAFHDRYFSCTESNLIAGTIETDNYNLIVSQGRIQFTYDKWDTPLTEGTHTLFMVDFVVSQDTPEGYYNFDLSAESASYLLFDEFDALIGTEDVTLQMHVADVYVGEMLKANITEAQLYEGDTIQLFFNKPIDEQVVNYNEELLTYHAGFVTAKELPAGQTKQTGLLRFASADGSESVYVSITVLAENEVEPPPPTPTVPNTISASKYTVSSTCISKISAKTTVTTLLSGLNEREYIKVYRADGTTQVSGSTVVGTGYVVKLMDGDSVQQSRTLVVTGDVNGDGNITAADYVNVKFCVLGKQKLNGVFGQAADVNGDSKITASDYVNIKFDVLGKNKITPR